LQVPLKPCSQARPPIPLCAHPRRSRCLILPSKPDVRSGRGRRLLEAVLRKPQGGGL
jgi:hypothetical protein